MSETESNAIRRYELDWLRIFALTAVFLYHSVHFFDTGYWSIKNATTYTWISWLMSSIDVWVMPLFFMISGASIYYAANKRNALGFIRDKIMRLFVPLVASVFSFSIMQVYLERVSHKQYQGSFISFIPHYFEGLYIPGGTGNFAFHGMHLWYLLFIFVFSLLFMPLFWWFKGNAGKRVLIKIGYILELPGAIFLFFIPTAVLENFVSTGIENAGWQIVQFPWFFLAGYLFIPHQKLHIQIIKMRWIWFLLSMTLFLSSILTNKGPDSHGDILVWLEIFAILGFAMKHLNFSNKFLSYCNEAIMPIYILHQNILLLLGFFIVSWGIPDLIKYWAIAISSLFIIIILYEYVIRRFNCLRILFGMKLIKKNAQELIKPSFVE